MAAPTKVEGSVVAGTNCEEILKKYYGITPVTMSRQKGFADITYVVKATDGHKYVFKVLVHVDSKNERANYEVNVMEFVRKKGVNVPQTLPTKDGALLGEEDFEDETRGRHRKAFRVIEFIEGRTMWMPDDEDQSTPELAYEMGLMVGKTDAALNAVDFIDVKTFAQLPTYPLAASADMTDLIEGMSKMPELTDDQRQWCLSWKKDLFEPLVIAKEAELHKQLIHCDIHVGNFIFSEERSPVKVKAIFDFGNIIYALRLIEVGGGLLNFVMFGNDPVACMEAFLKGYTQSVELSQTEKKAIFAVLASRAIHVILYHTWCKENVPSYNKDYIGGVIGNRLWPMIERFMTRQSPEEKFLTAYAEQ